MTLQVIVATMNQTDYSLLERMNIQSDAIVCNQCDKTEFCEFEYKGHNIKWLSFAERGVGLNRNNGLMRASADIILFADDDVVYYDGYADSVLQYYENNPTADVVLFNFAEQKKDGTVKYRINKDKRVYQKGITGYGAICISAKREKLHFQNIFFHIQFGGGTQYSCGEDTLFLQDCCKKNLRVYTTQTLLGSYTRCESSWFRGYTDKFFYDKGVLYLLINRNWAVLFALYHCFKHKDIYLEYGWIRAFAQMRKGISDFKN